MWGYYSACILKVLGMISHLYLTMNRSSQGANLFGLHLKIIESVVGLIRKSWRRQNWSRAESEKCSLSLLSSQIGYDDYSHKIGLTRLLSWPHPPIISTFWRMAQGGRKLQSFDGTDSWQRRQTFRVIGGGTRMAGRSLPDLATFIVRPLNYDKWFSWCFIYLTRWVVHWLFLRTFC